MATESQPQKVSNYAFKHVIHPINILKYNINNWIATASNVSQLQSTTTTLDGPALLTASAISDGPTSNASDGGITSFATATLDEQISTATAITEVHTHLNDSWLQYLNLNGPYLDLH